MGLFGPKSSEYGDLNRKSLNEINETVEKQEETLANPFAGGDPGLVPASDETTQAKYLRGDGEWANPPGGGGGTSDYNDLANKPAIDGTTLDKNSTAEDLGLAKKTEIPDLTDYAKKTDIPAVPTKTSDLQNDSGFLTSESDPTVPSWAKQQNPPTPYVEVSDTLTAGQTSVTLSNAAITSSSTIDIYTDSDVDYVSATPGTGSITITFEEQQADLGVKVRVS